jgi:HEAT repeat protein
LAKILADEQEKPIFREYAAEALGNIGDSSFLPTISSIASKTSSPEIRRSCEFALEEIPAIAARQSNRSS